MSRYIELKNVSKTFITKRGPHEVVRDVNFTVDQNELVAIFGPGQSGKTTLLKSITKPGRDYIALDRKKDIKIARDDQKASFMIHRLTYLIDKIQRGR